MKPIIATIALLTAAASASAVTPLWMRDVQISPDGSSIAFTYKGDIWTVPASGGEATRITSTPSYEANPIWSPDSRTLAFASDRNGSFDIFTVPAKGGTATRLTSNSASEIPQAFTPDGKYVMFSAAIQDPASSAMFPTSRMTELYKVSVAGGPSVQVVATPVEKLNYFPDGKKFLYQDLKGMEDEWRKHHTSSVTRDIWLYDASTGQHTNLTSRGGEDRDPVVAMDGKKFFFLSERDGGSMNVYEASIASPAQVKSLTSFRTHPVRFLSHDKNDRLCFTYDGEIYTLAPGGKPSKVNISLTDDGVEDISRQSLRGISSTAFSPDGKQAAFVSRGNVFVTSVDYPSTKQITSTPAAEKSPTWSKDGKTLVYASDRENGVWNLYKATLGHEADPNFSNATIIEEDYFVKPDGHDRTIPQFSPDGKKMAFVYDRHNLAVMDIESKKMKVLTSTALNPQTIGALSYAWSPDSKWIALEINDRRHEPYTDIAIVNIDNPEVINITNSGYTDSNPKWVLDGNALLFESERYGMRNHASWGSMGDMMLVFLNQEAQDKFNLSEEDYALYKDAEKEAKKNKEKDKEKDKDKSDADDKAEDSENLINVEVEGIQDRVIRLTPTSSSLYDFILNPEGDVLYYINGSADGAQLWKLGLRKEDEHRLIGKTTGYFFDYTPDLKNIFIVGGSSMKKFSPGSDKQTAISYSGTQKIDHPAEREYMFEEVIRAESERFYDKGMHGVDWPAMAKAYRKFLPHINNNYDYAEMLSEILGELNVSHTGGRYYPSLPGDRTASLGLLYDLTYGGNGLKVDEIVAGGPFAKAASKMSPGSVITAVNGNALDAGADYTAIFNDVVGKKVLVDFTTPSGEKVQEVVVPVSSGVMNSLLYKRWVKNRAADVDRWSNGRLGYVHIASMDDGSFRKVYSDLLGKYNDREGVVVDIRWNGGGRLHEDVEVLLSGEKYLTQVIRGVESCDMPSRRWNKPSIMVMGEPCYSNAHGTPWVYKHQGIGKLVGMPVPGTMTSVNWITMQDPSLVYGIPVIGYRTADGTYLENSQLEPDIKISNDPAVVVTGEDQQLHKAVEVLLQDIDAKKK